MTTIKATGVTFAYHQHLILQSCNFVIPNHQLSVLTGPTGSGKSTLLALLGKLRQPQAGNISPQPAGLMFQNPRQQFAMATAFDQFVFSLENLQVEPALARKKICAITRELNLQTILHQPLTTLSGGQLQRVALAAALLMNRGVLLLDEPFASVDPDNRQFLLKVLHSWQEKRGETILIVDHDLHGYEKICQHVFQLQNRQVTELKPAEKEALWTKKQPALQFSSVRNEPAIFRLQQFSLQRGPAHLLSKTSLILPAGQTTLLTGPNGSGKSSLLQVFSKLLPYQGSCRFRGKEISQWAARPFFKQVKQVFQTASDQFLTPTVGEEIALSEKNSPLSAADQQEMLADFKLQDLAKQSPYLLSGGQQKLLQLAVILLLAPSVLLLDEPLAGLDQAMTQAVAKWLTWSRVHFQQTQLLVSHQPGLNSLCQHHLLLQAGQLQYQEA